MAPVPSPPGSISELLDSVPHSFIWVGVGFLLSQAARIIAFFTRKDRDSVEKKLVKLFSWAEGTERALNSFKEEVAKTYATKRDLEIVAEANREDHKEIKDLVIEVRSMLEKRAIHGAE